jgi:hypothetical protein
MLALLQEVGGSNHLAPKKQCRFTIGLSLTCFYKPGEIAEEMSESENAREGITMFAVSGKG